ncbi:hypothetical protein RHMOL_Rhmol03G0004400 [Rhododendron molle]|uniref:Uncharacterized protein n=1 Tax=Rhododendron molle TaxID=49168 RepID=A0ACC0PAH2_RHOML|nr:hypothetical protein RHMOL_Rhmol03G0004400 [Rhododendron molle]
MVSQNSANDVIWLHRANAKKKLRYGVQSAANELQSLWCFACWCRREFPIDGGFCRRGVCKRIPYLPFDQCLKTRSLAWKRCLRYLEPVGIQVGYLLQCFRGLILFWRCILAMVTFLFRGQI